MRFAKVFAIAACAGLLVAGAAGSARHAFAQDDDDADQSVGTLSAPDADSADDATPDAKQPPLDIAGCWNGTVNDEGDGGGTAFFQFVVAGNGKKIQGGGNSGLDFEWPDMRGAES